MTARLFFYGTLMAGFERRRTAGLDDALRYLGRGRIRAKLYDVGEYPAARPDTAAFVWGEVYETDASERVLTVLDGIEGCDPGDAAASLYSRELVEVRLPEGLAASAWVYFYNRPVTGLTVVPSGDYAAYLAARQ